MTTIKRLTDALDALPNIDRKLKEIKDSIPPKDYGKLDSLEARIIEANETSEVLKTYLSYTDVQLKGIQKLNIESFATQVASLEKELDAKLTDLRPAVVDFSAPATPTLTGQAQAVQFHVNIGTGLSASPKSFVLPSLAEPIRSTSVSHEEAMPSDDEDDQAAVFAKLAAQQRAYEAEEKRKKSGQSKELTKALKGAGAAKSSLKEDQAMIEKQKGIATVVRKEFFDKMALQAAKHYQQRIQYLMDGNDQDEVDRMKPEFKSFPEAVLFFIHHKNDELNAIRLWNKTYAPTFNKALKELEEFNHDEKDVVKLLGNYVPSGLQQIHDWAKTEDKNGWQRVNEALAQKKSLA